MTELKMPTDAVVVCLENRVQGPHCCSWPADAYLHLPFSWLCFLFALRHIIMPPVLDDIFLYLRSINTSLVLESNCTDSIVPSIIHLEPCIPTVNQLESCIFEHGNF